MNIEEILFENRDLKYRDFHCRLIPNVNPDTIIGVRTPILRKTARELYKNEDISRFLNTLPHKYYEENNLHAFLIEQIMDFDKCIAELNRFLPYVDNWATCDAMRPKCFAKNKDRMIAEAEKWIAATDVYTVRFGIRMLMVFCLEDSFDERYLRMVSEIKSEEYYINMMIAWYFATALAKQWDSAFVYITENRLSAWVHNKTIQKAVESYRITKDRKEILKKLRR